MMFPLKKFNSYFILTLFGLGLGLPLHSLHSLEKEGKEYKITNISIVRKIPLFDPIIRRLEEISSEDTVATFTEKVTPLLSPLFAPGTFLVFYLNEEILVHHKKMGHYFPKEENLSPSLRVETIGHAILNMPEKHKTPFLLFREECEMLLQNMPLETCIFWKNREDHSLTMSKRTSNKLGDSYIYEDTFSRDIEKDGEKLRMQIGNCIAYTPTNCMDEHDFPKIPTLNNLALSLCKKNIQTYSQEVQGYIHSLHFSLRNREGEIIP